MDTGEKYRFVLNDWIKLLEESDSWREIAVYQDEPEDKLPGRSSVAHTESHALYCTLQAGDGGGCLGYGLFIPINPEF